MKRGFTLVELSIVLVIIGLLISGLLVGQSMIKATKVQSAIREVQQYSILFSNFKEMYGQLPGDTNLFANAGDKDGQIEYPGGGAQGEWYRAWQHLYEAGFVNVAYTGLKNGNLVIGGENAPDSGIYDEAVYTVMYQAGSGYVSRGHYFFLGAPSAGSLNTTGIVDVNSALAIDVKIDDGEPDAGDVIGYTVYSYQPSCYTNIVQSGGIMSSCDYNVGNSTGICTMMFRQTDW